MTLSDKEKKRSSRLIKYFVIAGVSWTVFILILLFWGMTHEQENTRLLAIREARTHLFEDHALELWVNLHGTRQSHQGQAPASFETPLHENRLDDSPARDHLDPKNVTSFSAKHMLAYYPSVEKKMLTVNHSIFKEGGVLSAWQIRAVEAFQNDAVEFHEVSEETGISFLHLSTPIMANDTCMIQCHRVNKVPFRKKITALGISIPLEELQVLKHEEMARLVVSLGVIWVLGLFGIGFGGKRILLHLRETEKLNRALEEEKSKTLFSKAQFEAIFDSITDGVVFTDLNRQILMVNPAFTRLLGYSYDEIKGQSTRIYYKNYEDFVCKGIERFRVDAVFEEPVYEIEYKRKDGSVFMSETLGTKVHDHSGEVIGFLGVIRDITDRHAFQREAVKNRKRLEVILRLNELRDETVAKIIGYGLEQSILLTDSLVGYFYYIGENQEDNRLYIWPPDVEKQCGLEQEKVFPPNKAGIWADCIRSGKPVIHNNYHKELKRKGYPEGHMFIARHMSIPLIDDKKAVAILGVGNKEEIYTDFDEQQLSILSQNILRLLMRHRSVKDKMVLETRLQRASKMEAIGTLAGGIAHDFNNILGIIHGNADMVLDDLPAKSPNRKNIDRILQAAVRAKDIIRQILLYSRQSEVILTPLKPCELLKETLELLRATVPSTVKIEQLICPESHTIMADKSQFQQLLMNLFVNAVDAMDEKGDITVIGERVDLQLTDFIDRRGAKPGAYFRVIIADTGIGMDEQLMERIFDPFFTTKNATEGTGLGLATVKGIVENHNGLIRVTSTPGSGTTFHILFPLSGQKEEALDAEAGQLTGGRERVMFVDDEEMYAEMGEVMLSRLGYQVKSMTSSKLALEVFRAYPEAFDLVITDQTMPDLSGLEFSEELLRIRPDIPIILCTGYSRKVDRKTALDRGIREFLPKPLDKQVLSRAIRTVLNSSARG